MILQFVFPSRFYQSLSEILFESLFFAAFSQLLFKEELSLGDIDVGRVELASGGACWPSNPRLLHCGIE